MSSMPRSPVTTTAGLVLGPLVIDEGPVGADLRDADDLGPGDHQGLDLELAKRQGARGDLARVGPDGAVGARLDDHGPQLLGGQAGLGEARPVAEQAQDEVRGRGQEPHEGARDRAEDGERAGDEERVRLGRPQREGLRHQLAEDEGQHGQDQHHDPEPELVGLRGDRGHGHARDQRRDGPGQRLAPEGATRSC